MIQDTSREAYQSVLPTLGDRQREVLEALGSEAQCGWDVANKLGLPPNYVSPRLRELNDLGLIVESHRAKYEPTGRKAIYWKAIL